jgi:XTP/dITP diphosphohydrolase
VRVAVAVSEEAERPPLRLRLASGNPHKLTELRRILAGAEIALLRRDDYPPETGATYAENARGKAAFGRLHAEADEWVVGEDSGIEVDALGGRPGIHSARWADDGVARLLEELTAVDDRRGRYVCAMVALGPQGEDVVVEGELVGRIGHGRQGVEGFGYDPVFIPSGQTRTVAELGDGWKERHSHRASAARLLAAHLGLDSPR